MSETITLGGITVPVYDCPPEWEFLIPSEESYEPQAHEVTALAAAYRHHQPIALVGPTGSGKNGLVRWFLNKIRRPMFLVSAAEGTGIDQFIGSVVPTARESGGFTVEFRYGALPLSIRAGGCLVIDELNAADPRVLMRLHDYLANGERLTIYEDPSNDGKYISPLDAQGQHNGWMCVATMNPADSGQYAGTQQLNEATLDRFLVYELDYLGLVNPAKEAEVIARAAGIKSGKALRIVNTFNVVRRRARMTDKELASSGSAPIFATASTRKAIHVGMLSKDMPIMRAVEIGFVNKLNIEDRPVVHKLFLDQFASDGGGE